MKTFLQVVAHDIHNKLGSNLSRVAMVFPNKRASLFFNEYLASESTDPIWSPSYLSISELLQSLSDLQLGDDIRLITLLYKVFQEHTQSNETLDDFYFWGELLLSDFDDVDKNKVNTTKLFNNIKDLRDLVDINDFLDEEQEAAIRTFFDNFSLEKRTILKERFISLWDELGNIYTGFQEKLLKENIAYEGMLYRNNIEKFDVNNLKYDHYVFVGFNVLNEIETSFFKKLNDAGKALFYWDYDLFYTQNRDVRYHEAGEFINQNLKLFPNQLPASYFDSLKKPKNITYISSSTEMAQARYLPQWIENNFGPSERETAVVLCNESLLLPVLHSIPSTVQNVNITMGFPLSQTPIFSLISALMTLQNSGLDRTKGYYHYKSVLSVLKHPYTKQLEPKAEEIAKEIINKNKFYLYPSEFSQSPYLSHLFSPQLEACDLCEYLKKAIELVTELYNNKDKNEESIFDQLYRESLFKAYTTINKIYLLIEAGELPIKSSTLQHLIDKVLSSATIPFHGEPAIGMQIMGVLETRNLDFKNLVMLSVNEGQLPKASSYASFIPYNLRKAFGMTTIEHQNAVYAYYFYRLIQRAENITLLYNTASDGINKGEISRFMLQLLVESGHLITQKSLDANYSLSRPNPIVFEKTQEVYQKLRDRYDISLQKNSNAILSPSALNSYLDCRLKFYYRYIANLRAPNEVSDEIDAALFGNIFHHSAELILKELQNIEHWIYKEDIEKIFKEPYRVERAVDQAFKELFFKDKSDTKPQYNGIQLINRKVIISYIEQLLKHDLPYTPFQVKGMEKTVKREVQVSTPAGAYSINLGGNIDRLDLKEGILRIVDYKTGGNAQVVASINELFEPAERRPNYVFQTFLYADIVSDLIDYHVAPSLLYIHRAAGEEYSPVIQMGEPYKEKIDINNFKMVKDDFRRSITELIKDLFERDTAFTQTEFTDQCSYCDFKALCGR